MPDAYEDRTHDMFEHSNHNSSDKSLERARRMEEPFYGFTKKGTRITKAAAVGPGDRQFQQMFDHNQ